MSEGARSGGEEKERVARAQARFFLKMLNGFVPFSAVGERQAEAAWPRVNTLVRAGTCKRIQEPDAPTRPRCQLRPPHGLAQRHQATPRPARRHSSLDACARG